MGFVTNEDAVWGRPVGVTVAHDGSLMVTDDGSNSVWRVSYVGTEAGREALGRSKWYNLTMKTSVSAKRCPQCGKVTGLHTSECAACGHQFRTRFAETVERTEAFDAFVLPRPPASAGPAPLRRRSRVSPFVLAFLGSFGLVATAGLAAWLAWNFTRGLASRPAAPDSPAASLASAPASFPAGARRGRAEDLYERIEIAMSLYDVDQTAGGMGRLARSSNPHLLLLSYDYPDQSVRVSLFRNDLASDDYRVQAVALYRGNLLLHRHADDN